MEDDFRDKIIPNLLNEAQARIQMEELITDSIKTIGQEMADALIQEPDNCSLFWLCGKICDFELTIAQVRSILPTFRK